MLASSAQNMPAPKVSVLPEYGSGPWGLGSRDFDSVYRRP